MDTFFTPGKIWRDGGPYPHFLVTLGENPEFTAYARAARRHLAPYAAELGIVPDPWLHITIQGIFSTVTGSQLEDLRAAAREELDGMPAFDLQAGPARVGDTAVTVYLWAKDGLAELTSRARVAVRAAGVRLRDPGDVYFAHASLAYSRRSWDSSQLAQAFKPEPVDRVTFSVDHVSLVSQRQHPEEGLYDWHEIERYLLEKPQPQDGSGSIR